MKIPGIFFGIMFYLCVFPHTASAQILFSEISWAGTHASGYDEWIELRNISDTEVDLTNWTIEAEDGTPNIVLQGKIPGKNFFLLERTDDSTTSVSADQIYTGSLKNSGETLLLKSGNGVIQDQIYSPWSAGSNETKSTMERFDLNTWKTFSGIPFASDAKGNDILGTPRAKNSQENFPSPPKKASFFDMNITEVSPTRFNGEDEWFEVRIESDGYVDVSEIVFVRGKYKKTMNDISPHIEWNSEDFPGKNLSGKKYEGLFFPEKKTIVFPKKPTKIPGIFEGYFFFPKSPFSLPDGGGEILIEHRGEVLDRFLYPKTQKKRDSTEIWNKDYETNEIYPLLYKPPNFPHSKGFPNISPPKIESNIILSEIGMNREKSQEFFEFFVSEDANLKYTELVYNGKSVWFMDEDYWVKKGDFVLIYGNEGAPISQEKNIHVFSGSFDDIKTSSSSLFLYTFGKTSFRTMFDFACWKNKTMSQTETNRIQKFLGNNTACFETQGIRKNQSFARRMKEGILEKTSIFTPHFIGSPGFRNTNPSLFNQSPQANIKIQSVSEKSINVTGEYSFDANGNDDILSFRWSSWIKNKARRFLRKRLSSGKNPRNFSLSDHKTIDQKTCENSSYILSLIVSDFSGAMNERQKKFPLVWDTFCRIQIPKKISGIFISEEIPKKEAPKNTALIYNPETFFHDFLSINSDVQEFETKELSIQKIPEKIFRRDRFFVRMNVSPEYVRKNIGIIFEY